jgi:hypothetical protein
MRIYKTALVVVVTSLASTSFGQLKLGFTAGANYNMPSYKMSSQDTLSNTNEYRGLGANFGLYGYLNLAGKDQTYGVQAELLVSTRTHTTYSQSTQEVNSEIFYFNESHALQNMMYADLPVHFRFNKVFKKGKFGDANLLGIFVGPQASFMLSAKYDVDHTSLVSVQGGQETILRENSKTPTFEYSPFEIGFSAGVLYEMQVGFRVGVRFYRSFMSAADHERLSINHQMLMGFVGFNFAKIGGR